MMRVRGQQLSFNDRDNSDGRGRARQDLLQRFEGSRRIALREADRRVSVPNLARSRFRVGERLKRGARFASHPQAGLGGDLPAGDLARQRV
jgi:hypothetical protein